MKIVVYFSMKKRIFQKKKWNIFIFFIIQKLIGKKILKISFKIDIKSKINENNLMENLYKNRIYAEIEIVII